MLRVFLPISGVVAVAACSEAIEIPEETTVASAVQCTAPEAVLHRSDPFADALERWTNAPRGDKAALAGLDAVCAAGRGPDAFGTELAACTLLGLVQSSGEGMPRDASAAARYFAATSGCETFDFGGDDLHQARSQSIFVRSVACCGAVGCARGCEMPCALARRKIAHRLVPLLERACTAGRGTACFMLGQASSQYVRGIGNVESPKPIESDRRDALMNRACDAGVGPACSFVDRPEASCDAGWPSGCLDRGRVAFEAHGEMLEAVPWYEKACRLGQSAVCNELGDMFSLGEHGVPVDHERAVKSYANAWR